MVALPDFEREFAAPPLTATVEESGATGTALDPGRRDELQPVTTKNVARSDVLFPKQLLQELDAQCGSPTAMHLSRSAAATAEAEMEEDA